MTIVNHFGYGNTLTVPPGGRWRHLNIATIGKMSSVTKMALSLPLINIFSFCFQLLLPLMID